MFEYKITVEYLNDIETFVYDKLSDAMGFIDRMLTDRYIITMEKVRK